jgi:hypothetical protein
MMGLNYEPQFLYYWLLWSTIVGVLPKSYLIYYVQYGVEFVAEHVLPLLMPLLTAQQLNVQQFAKYMLFVKNMLQ